MEPDEYFIDCCKECNGKCCQGVYITEDEYGALSSEFQKPFIKHFFGYRLPLDEKCFFLSEEGCILGEDRFLECKLYPYEISGINELILRKECPAHKIYENSNFYSNALDLFFEYKLRNVGKAMKAFSKNCSVIWFTPEDVFSISKNPDNLF